MSKYAKRVDGDHRAIVSDLTDAHLSVCDLSRVGQGVCDLLVGGVMPCPHCGARYKQNKLIEIKTKGRDLNERQETFFTFWKGPRIRVYTAAEALRECGVKV